MECFVDMKICDVYSNLCSTIKAWRKKIKPPSKVDLEVIFKGGFALFKQKEKMTNQLFENQKKKKRKKRYCWFVMIVFLSAFQSFDPVMSTYVWLNSGHSMWETVEAIHSVIASREDCSSAR